MKITFYLHTVSTSGQEYNASMASFEFEPSVSPEEATRQAKEQFQAQMGIKHWQDRAHTYELS